MKQHTKLVKSVTSFGVIAGALLASQCAHAADEWVNPDWANAAWYIGAGIGRSQANIDEERLSRSLMAGGSTAVRFDSREHDTAIKLYLGKQLNKNFAVELGYFDLGKFGFNAVTVPASRLNGDVSFRGVNLDLLGQFPLSQRFSVYGRVGMNYAQARAHFTGNRLFAVTNPNPSERKLNPKVGVGLEYKFSEALAMRAELERYRVNDAVGNRGDVDLLSFNLVYKLGRPASSAPVYVAAPEPAPLPVEPTPVQPQPQPAPVVVSEKVSLAAEALFDFDKSVLKPEGKAALDGLLAQLQGMNTEVMITVGHTDSVGSPQYNQKLSIRRAEAVKAYVVSKGLDTSRVYTEGKGEAQPLADNKSAEGRAKNRRVTVEVVGTRGK
ncbi:MULTISPECIES: OmpA family protein [unclassified Janthinobacterium]|uniref:OmpA family protein n=1 Tax=unclassified Janthinobacterium TaxID=2610881 RepID=UPI00034CCC97|nr:MULTISPECIES: OmpA family protein [unclassified Janthinobacterium]MEC5159837.1 OOP family OmpA-OmpF porin [Janthinobacterium sp. CG_S6]